MRYNTKLKKTKQMNSYKKNFKNKKILNQLYFYFEKKYVIRNINNLNYKKNIISLLYKFVEKIMTRNLDKKMYVIKNNISTHVKTIRLYKKNRIKRNILKIK